jgi:hypothetical protein
MIAIDTDVLAIHHVFHNDPRYEATEKFLFFFLFLQARISKPSGRI